MIEAKAVPAVPDFEFAMLGSLMGHPEWWDEVGFDLTEDDFVVHGNRQIFSAIRSLSDAGKPVDMLLVWEEMKRLDLADSMGLQDVSRIAAMEWSSKANLHRYAEKIKEATTARKLIEASGEIASVARDDALTAAQRVDRANAELEKVNRPDTSGGPKPISDFAARFIDILEAKASGEVEPGMPTHIPKLDRLLAGGLRPGNQVIIAARPSVGKSSLALQICINAALDRRAAAFFSMEMSNQELTDRVAANLGRVPLEGISTGKLDPEGWTGVTEGVERMRNLPLYVYERAALSLSEITSRARMLKRKQGLQLLVLDYLQLTSPSNPSASRHHQIEETSRGLKSLAKQLGITILTLSQLNREVEKRSSPKPTLSDLKESGAIEEDADVILMLWTDSRNDETGQRTVGCAVPKNRQGRTGELALHFDGPIQRWTESTEELQAGKRAASQGSKFGGEF